VVALVESRWGVSAGPDGERVSVVGEDRPCGPDLLALVALEAAAVQTVAAFEVADPSFGAGSVALQTALGASGAGLLAARDEHPFGRKVAECLGGRADVEASIERDLAREVPSRWSSAIVWGSSMSSPGLPGAVTDGTISPRAPRLVFSVTSAS